MSDVNGALWAKTYDGNAWSAANDGAPLVNEVSSRLGVPFDLVFR